MDIYMIDLEKCLGCGACADQCPAEAIIEIKGAKKPENNGKFWIKIKDCLSCGSCADQCPAKAISMVSEEIHKKVKDLI